MNEYIYGLYHYINGEKEYFYVGRSSREVGVRFNEHRYAVNSLAKRFKTDVYEYIRNNVLCTIFEEDILCICEDENPEDYEDFYVIKLIREGFSLRNEKHGDAKRLAAFNELKDIAASKALLRTVKELREYRQKRRTEAYERSDRLQQEIKEKDFYVHSPVPASLKAKFKQMDAETAQKAKENAEKAAKKARLKASREADYQQWLNAQRHLFENQAKNGEK